MTTSDFTPLADAHHRKRVAFDPTINLGHVLTFIGFLVTGFSAYSALDKRVTLVEQQAVVGTERSREQDTRMKDSLLEIRADLKDLQRSVNDVNRTLTAPRQKP